MAELSELLGERETSRDDKGRFAAPPAEVKDTPRPTPTPEAKVEVKPEVKPETPATPPPGYLPAAAVMDERRKRQELEARLKAFENPPKPAPNKEEDLPGYVDHRLGQVEQDAHNRFLNAVEAAARTRYKDYDDKRAVFLEAAASNPMLLVQCNQQPDPSEFVYRKALELQELQDVGGDFVKYKEKLEKQLREKWDAEHKAPTVIPQSLNGAPSPVPTAAYQGPPPLGSILRNKF